MAEIDLVESATTSETDDEKAHKSKTALAKFWIAEIAAAEKGQEKWVQRAKKIEKIYNDERDASSNRTQKFNVLWSNVETQRPAIFIQTPVPRAVRRYSQKDPVARFAALLIERNLQVSCDQYGFEEEVDQAVRDRLVPGRGQMWVFYDPTIEGQGDDEVLAYEQCTAEYVPWQDFLHSIARTWREVWWVGRRFYKTRRELKDWLKERGLDPKLAAQVKLDFSVEGDKADEGLKDQRNKAVIWEVHNKRDGEVLYVAPGSGTSAILGRQPPAVRFRDFFPCPMPMLATTTANTLIPTPDFVFYQDQAKELDTLQQRIDLLLKALKVAGVYNAANKEIASLLNGAENKMVAVDDWAAFAEGGGVKGQIEWYPVEVVAAVLEKLYLAFEAAKQRLYEISGIGDILRGATDPDETATAQGIKARWGSLRQRRNQKRSTSFLDAIFQLKAEVICERFKFETIMEAAGVDDALLEQYIPAPPQPPPPQIPPDAPPEAQQMAQQQMQQQQAVAKQQARAQFLSQVEQLLRNDAARTFRITVQPDSMLEPDRQEEKQTAVEFLTAVGTYMKEAGPLVQMGPAGAKLAGEMLLFGVRRFDRVDELEETVEQFVEEMSKPRPPAPDPEMMKIKAEVEGKKAELQMKGEAQQQELGMKREMHQMDMAAKVQEVQIDGAIKQQEMQQRAQEGEQKLELQAAQGDQKMRQGEQAMSINERKAESERAIAEGSPP